MAPSFVLLNPPLLSESPVFCKYLHWILIIHVGVNSLLGEEILFQTLAVLWSENQTTFHSQYYSGVNTAFLVIQYYSSVNTPLPHQSVLFWCEHPLPHPALQTRFSLQHNMLLPCFRRHSEVNFGKCPYNPPVLGLFTPSCFRSCFSRGHRHPLRQLFHLLCPCKGNKLKVLLLRD